MATSSGSRPPEYIIPPGQVTPSQDQVIGAYLATAEDVDPVAPSNNDMRTEKDGIMLDSDPDKGSGFDDAETGDREDVIGPGNHIEDDENHKGDGSPIVEAGGEKTISKDDVLDAMNRIVEADGVPEGINDDIKIVVEYVIQSRREYGDIENANKLELTYQEASTNEEAGRKLAQEVCTSVRSRESKESDTRGSAANPKDIQSKNDGSRGGGGNDGPPSPPEPLIESGSESGSGKAKVGKYEIDFDPSDLPQAVRVALESDKDDKVIMEALRAWYGRNSNNDAVLYDIRAWVDELLVNYDLGRAEVPASAVVSPVGPTRFQPIEISELVKIPEGKEAWENWFAKKVLLAFRDVMEQRDPMKFDEFMGVFAFADAGTGLKVPAFGYMYSNLGAFGLPEKEAREFVDNLRELASALHKLHVNSTYVFKNRKIYGAQLDYRSGKAQLEKYSLGSKEFGLIARSFMGPAFAEALEWHMKLGTTSYLQESGYDPTHPKYDPNARRVVRGAYEITGRPKYEYAYRIGTEWYDNFYNQPVEIPRVMNTRGAIRAEVGRLGVIPELSEVAERMALSFVYATGLTGSFNRSVNMVGDMCDSMGKLYYVMNALEPKLVKRDAIELMDALQLSDFSICPKFTDLPKDKKARMIDGTQITLMQALRRGRFNEVDWDAVQGDTGYYDFLLAQGGKVMEVIGKYPDDKALGVDSLSGLVVAYRQATSKQEGMEGSSGIEDDFRLRGFLFWWFMNTAWGKRDAMIQGKKSKLMVGDSMEELRWAAREAGILYDDKRGGCPNTYLLSYNYLFGRRWMSPFRTLRDMSQKRSSVRSWRDLLPF